MAGHATRANDAGALGPVCAGREEQCRAGLRHARQVIEIRVLDEAALHDAARLCGAIENRDAAVERFHYLGATRFENVNV